MSSSQTQVRQATPSDAGALARLVEHYWTFESIDNYDSARVQRVLRDALVDTDRAACWVTEDDGALTGYLFAVFTLSLEHGGLMAEIDEFFIVPRARGSGAGRTLLRHAEHAMKRLGIIHLQLQLAVGNAHARDFYLAHGYGRRVGYELWDRSLDA